MTVSTSSERLKIDNLVKYISGYIDEVDYYEDYDESYDIIWLLNSEIYLSVYSQSITGPSYLFILALSWCFI